MLDLPGWAGHERAASASASACVDACLCASGSTASRCQGFVQGPLPRHNSEASVDLPDEAKKTLQLVSDTLVRAARPGQTDRHRHTDTHDTPSAAKIFRIRVQGMGDLLLIGASVQTAGTIARCHPTSASRTGSRWACVPAAAGAADMGLAALYPPAAAVLVACGLPGDGLCSVA